MGERIMRFGRPAEHIPTANQLRVRIEQNFVSVKTMSLARVVRAVQPIAIFEVFDIDVEHLHRKYVPDPKL